MRMRMRRLRCEGRASPAATEQWGSSGEAPRLVLGRRRPRPSGGCLKAGAFCVTSAAGRAS
ncbi:hypothetical protein ACFPRL_28890 [Pseudoclavibacter helvolus]